MDSSMSKRHLLEAASLVSESASEDGTWKVRLISEGRGSSGIYTRELLENHHSAFDNVLSYKNHPVGWDGPQSRDFTMIAGEIVGETWVENDERGLVAVYGNYLPDEEYRTKLERYKSKLGLSIFIEGSGYENENGDFVVDWFNPEDPFASVDVVVAPGARGKFMESMQKVYSARVEEEKPTVTVAEEKNGEIMEEKLDQLIDLMSSLVADKKTEESAKAQVEADEAVATVRVESFAAAVKAVDEADLFDSQRESILESAKEGVDVAPLIEQAKKIKAEAVESVKESVEIADAGLVLGADSKKFSLTKIAEAK